MDRPRYARPTDAELQILAVLWRRGGCTVREMYLELNPIRGSGYNSVLKLMQIMHDRGYIKRDDTKRPQVYTAVMGEAATKKLLIRDLITRVFGSGGTLMLDTLRAQRIPTPELTELRAALDKQLASR